MLHDLKTCPAMFADLKSGKKRFELRRDDRPFEEGDTLLLREWTHKGGYSGQQMCFRVRYVLREAEPFGLMAGFCAMSIKLESGK